MFYFVSVSLGKCKTILNVSSNFNVLVILPIILVLFFIYHNTT